jgi:hypothetical protein
MRRVAGVECAVLRRVAYVLVLAALALPARADHGPVIVGPGGLIVLQDWGLHRPGHGVPRILDGPLLIPEQRIIGLPGPLQRYFPSGVEEGDLPRPRKAAAPVPAEPYFRSWQSHPVPLFDTTRHAPFEPPAVIYAPRDLPPK